MNDKQREPVPADMMDANRHVIENDDPGHPALRRRLVMRPEEEREKFRQAERMRRAMTPAEAILWQHLRANRLQGFHFRRQQVIAGFIVDFYCHAVGLVVEVDGEVHATQTTYDAERDRVLATHGLRLLRVQNREIERNLPTVLARIAAACAR
jgi:very-short-patch-repair endonuclease